MVTPPRDLPCVDPHQGSWRYGSATVAWHWDLPPGSPERPQRAWAEDRVREVLEALRPLGRVRHAELDPGPQGPPLKVPTATWDDHGHHQDFEEHVVARVRGAVHPVLNLAVSLDLWAQVRLVPGGPLVRAGIPRAAELDFHLDPDDPHLSLGLNVTLYRDGAPFGDDNRPLHQANAAVLQAGLDGLTGRLGPPVELEGGDDVVASGFLPRS